MGVRSKRRLARALLNLFFILGCVIYLVPFALALVNAFKSAPEAQRLQLTLPTEFHPENFLTVIQEGDLIRAAANGLIYSVSTTVLIVICCSLSAFILVRRASRAASRMQTYFTLGLIIPSAIIPTFVVMKVLHLTGTYVGLILLYTSMAIPTAMFLYFGFVSGIPRELDEAAFMDGAKLPTAFFRVIFPTMKPITATVAVFTFMTVWNDFQTQLYFASSKMRAMPLSVYFFFGQYSQSWNLVFADVLLTMLPVVLVYLFAQRYIISGMTAGAVKG